MVPQIRKTIVDSIQEQCKFLQADLCWLIFEDTESFRVQKPAPVEVHQTLGIR